MLTVLIIVFWFILVILATVFCLMFAMEATGDKKFSIIITIIADVVFSIISIVGICLVLNNQKNNETNSSNYTTEQTFYYKQTATAINEQMFQTEDGNIWIMKNVQLEKNEKYEITFDNHDTEIITDDEIVDFIKLNEKG